ncbi:MAG: ribosome maturation factor RimP [Deltaproteobacteria bacterium]|nr:ribosome maturation factor RimP [Deltaproteobacteria bacterium]
MEIAELRNHIEALVAPIMTELGLELIDLAIRPGPGRWTLQLSVDYPQGGVTVDDCARLSRSIEGVLDVEGNIPAAYNLEVSSPGVDRVLKRPSEFAQHVGRVVEIQTQAPIEGRGNFKGVVKEVTETAVIVEIDTVARTIPFGVIAKARLRYFEKG